MLRKFGQGLEVLPGSDGKRSKKAVDEEALGTDFGRNQRDVAEFPRLQDTMPSTATCTIRTRCSNLPDFLLHHNAKSLPLVDFTNHL